jgi:putative SOS response-associated peptidase YedK
MCGRASQRDPSRYEKYVAYWQTPGEFVPRSNIKPTEPAWIVARRDDGEIRTIEARWWCQWHGSSKFETRFPTFNARVETMHDKKMWSDLLKRGQRCLFPIDSFYEWPVKGKGLPPVEIFVEGRNPYALAGLWSRYTDEGRVSYSFTSFTTTPNDFMKPIHEKAMPVVLASIAEQKLWLEAGDEELLRPYDGGLEADQLVDTLERLYADENR